MSKKPFVKQFKPARLTPQQTAIALRAENYAGTRAAVKAMRKVVAYELLRRGWKAETIQQFIDRITYTFDSIGKEYITLEDIDQILKDERGLEV